MVTDRTEQSHWRTWRVWETDCRGERWARGATCLLADNGAVVRRVWSPPEAWWTLSDEALVAMIEATPGRHDPGRA